MEFIYFDNAATTIMKPPSVAEAVYHAIQTMGNGGRGTHLPSLHTGRIVYETREALATLFSAKSPKQIVFTSNATESLNLAIKGLLHSGDHVITTELEHNSVLRPLYEMEKKGVELTIIESDMAGNINYQHIEDNIKSNTKMIICTHCSNVTGNLIDIEKIGQICKKYNLIFVVDAAQTAGVFPIDVEKQNIDVLCFTGHKGLLGPQGIGGLYVKEGTPISPLKTGGSGFSTFSKKHPTIMPEYLEAGTLNGHGIAGLQAGVSYILGYGVEKIREKEKRLTEYFLQGIKDIPRIKIYGDFSSKERGAILSLNIGEYDSNEVCDELAQSFHICTRGGGHCAPLLHSRLGTKEQGVVRFSFSHFNTEEEINKAIEAIKTLAEDN